MKQTLISASIVAMLSSGAIAGNIDTATADPVITPPASTSTDWSGSYCGLSYSSGGGTESSAYFGTYDYVDDTAIGGFCGNNWQRNNLVYGGELNVTAGSLAIWTGVYDTFDELGTRTELRARVGYAMGDALVYGFLGYGTSDLTFVNTGTGYDVAGGTYGLGVDYMVTDRMFAGFEVSNLELTGTPTVGTGHVVEYTHDITVISLRIGWKFN
ncbi:outer membrane beta-barrel protein [Octadecabacter sp.]|nr:outer membrane beta-barrel protein [Octadecabacter sp.]